MQCRSQPYSHFLLTEAEREREKLCRNAIKNKKLLRESDVRTTQKGDVGQVANLIEDYYSAQGDGNSERLLPTL